MSDTGAEGTQAAQGTQETGGQPDLAPVLERIGQLGEQFTEFSSQFQPQGQEDYGQQYDYGQQEPGYQYGQPQYDQFGNQYQQDQGQQQGLDPNMGQQEAMGLLQQIVGQSVSQATAPLMERLNSQELEKHNGALEQQRQELHTKYPELAGEQGKEFETKASGQAMQIAAQIVPMIDPSLSRQDQAAMAKDLGQLLASQPGFQEAAYLASKAEVSAGQETPASTSQEFQLESGGGAAQSGQEQGSAGDQYLGMGNERPRKSLSELW